MSLVRKKRVAPNWWFICILLIVIVNFVFCSGHIRFLNNAQFNSSTEEVFQISSQPQKTGTGGSILEQEMSINGDAPNTTRKQRKVVRKRKKKVLVIPVPSPSVIKSVTMVPSTFSGENIAEMETTTQSPTHPNSNVGPNNKLHKKFRGISRKVPDVWSVQNFRVEQIDKSDLKSSLVEKRDSAENVPYNLTSIISELNETQRDLNGEESNNPFINSSTPISNELQNSLQFTLQILHPLLNSDTDLSDEEKIPEDKTVAVTHSLSGSVAQTPVAFDIGFLPTHLKKKHPLLLHESMFDGEYGLTRTGVRNKDDVNPVNHPTTKPTTRFTTLEYNPTAQISFEPTTLMISTPPITTPKPTISTTSFTTEISTSTKTIRKETNPVLRVRSTTSKPNSTSASVSLPPATTIVPELSGILLGNLNITELSSGHINSSSHPAQKNQEALEYPPLIMFPLEDQVTSSQSPETTTIATITPTSTVHVLQSSKDLSAEQLLIEQLLGIGSPPNAPSSAAADSTELLTLFNSLLQGQIQNQGQMLQNSVGPPTNSATAQTNAILQSLILSSLNKPQTQINNENPQDFAGTLLSLENLLTPSSPAPKPTKFPTFPITTSKVKPQVNQGLSDADLKSIFQFLEESQTTSSRPSSTPPTTTTTPKPSPPPRPTHPSLPLFTTTLHPALQSMLDMFTNQFKPFQGVPGTASPKPLLSPPPPTPPPHNHNNPLTSLDLLSQLLNLGGAGGNKVNPVRSTPSPYLNQQSQGKQKPSDFSLTSLFGNNNNGPPTPSESNLLNYFHPTPTSSPNGLYYWFDLNAFLGGDPKADAMAGIRPKIGNKYPFIKIGN